MTLYVLDTDSLSLYQRGDAHVCRSVTSHTVEELAITVISVEEQLSGWQTFLRRARTREQLARAYQRLTDNVTFLARLQILSFGESAVDRYDNLLALRLNIGKMDLRIAAITLEAGAILVTRNRRDFERVPGLRVEDWSTG